MKKISILFASIALAVGFTACDETKDDNPVLRTHEGTPTLNFLNTPSLQNMYINLTEANKQDNLHMTCSQPTEYGFATTVNYFVQVSLDKEFSYKYEIKNGFVDCSQINPLNDGIAEGICSYIQNSIRVSSGNPDYELQLADVTSYNNGDYYPVYLRLRSQVIGIPDMPVANTDYVSNVVEYKNMRAEYVALVPPDKPAGVFLMGGMNDWAANDAFEFYTTKVKGTFITKVVTIDGGVTFKVSPASWNSDFPYSGGVALNGGSPGGDAAIPVNEAYSLTNDSGSGNIFLKDNFEGIGILVQNGKNFKLTMVPADKIKDVEGIKGMLGAELAEYFEPYL